jgi:uncharacterized protein YkwD
MLRRTLITLATAAALALAIVGPASARSDRHWRQPYRVPAPTAADTTLRLLNDLRGEAGLRPLRPRTDLARAAVQHSRDMAARDYFSHGAMELRLLGYVSDDIAVVGENLAWGSGNQARATSAVTRWMASPGHRLNILDPAFRFVGIGVAHAHAFHGATSVTVYTVDFGG